MYYTYVNMAGKQKIDQAVDKISVLADDANRDASLILRLQYDVAAQLNTYPVIAKRYGFAGEEDLFVFLQEHPEITKNIKQIRALINSEENSETRVRMKAVQATEFLIATTTSIAADDTVSPQQRIDAFKQLSRVGGVDGVNSAAKGGAASGTAFTLNILFRNREKETLSFTPEEPDVALPSPRKPTSAIAIDPDDDGFLEEEDV